MVKTIVTLESNNQLTFNKTLLTDATFSKHAKRQIRKHVKGTYAKSLSSAFNKPVHLYSPQTLLKTLQQAKILPKLRQVLNVALDNHPITDLEAAKQMVKVFTDPIKPEDVEDKMQHATTNVDNVHRTRPFGSYEINGKSISTRLKTLETALKSLALIYDLPDDSNVLKFIANAAAIFRKLVYKSPNGKKTPCKFKNVRTINATKLPFPTIRQMEMMLEESAILSSPIAPTDTKKPTCSASTRFTPRC